MLPVKVVAAVLFLQNVCVMFVGGYCESGVLSSGVYREVYLKYFNHVKCPSLQNRLMADCGQSSEI